MIDLRQKAFNNISKIIAISRYDIEQRQLINDYGLNIHSENWFRDIFNFVYEYSFENANFENQNIAHIDLIDKTNKLIYQITTTRTKEKIENTLKALDNKIYTGYSLKIFYLLDKANPNKNTELELKYNINLKDCLLDYTDLITDINNLETAKLIELNNKYFDGIEEKYTEEITLNLVFKHLLKNHTTIKLNYDDDLGSIDITKKINLNNLNQKIINKINNGLEYISIINEIDSEDNLLSELRSLVVEDLYREVLLKLLATKVSKKEIENKTILELHNFSKSYDMNFNKVIHNLYLLLENKIDIKDFNSTSISWIIIAFFFEICDVGIKE